ncbi:MAG: GYF domain-containing protein, partial [Thermoguttaceae bacterium]
AAGTLMQGWLAEGRLSADSLVWREGWRDWQEAGSVFPQLKEDWSASPLETPLGAPPPTTVAGHPHRPKVHHGPSASQFTVIAVLTVAVAILIVVFLLVLLRQ